MVFQTSWIFRFSISSKNIGLMIRRLDSFVCKEFALFFLSMAWWWPSLYQGEKKWDQEREAEWCFVSNSSKKTYAQVTRASSVGQHKSVFARISFPHIYYQTNFNKVDLRKKLVFDRLSSPNSLDNSSGPKFHAAPKPRSKGSFNSNFKHWPADYAGFCIKDYYLIYVFLFNVKTYLYFVSPTIGLGKYKRSYSFQR